MRVLVVASPMVGHVLPLVPITNALRAAGHDVLLATGEDGTAAARSAGVPTADVDPRLRVGRQFLRTMLAHPGRARRELAGTGGTDVVGLLFARVADRLARGVVALAEEWRPDLVLHEPMAVVGSIAATRLGVPTVVTDASLFDADELFAATVARLRAATLRRAGVDRLPAPAAVLTTTPVSLAGPRRGQPMRFVPVISGEDGVPGDLTRRGRRPRIVVSRSTVRDPRPDRLMRRVVAAAADLDVEVVLARPDRRTARSVLPPNVRTAPWLPFPSVFPVAAGVIHHGGAGTVLTALACGLPQLVVPGAGDRRVNAGLIAARGAGLAVEGDRITREDLRRLVEDESLRRAARDVAAEIAAMPHPAEIVDRVSDLFPAAP